MQMRNPYSNSPFEAQLDFVATTRDQAILASIANPLTSLDALFAVVKAALDAGVSIDDVSEASGLSPQAIRDRLNASDEAVAQTASLH